MNRRSKTPGISRIDQPSHRTHGFFVRVHFRGKIYPAFFADKEHGGRKPALVAAKKGLARLRRKLGLPGSYSRRWNAEVVRRKGRSGIQGVRRIISQRGGGRRMKYWLAHWSPRKGVYRRKSFSIRKYGEEKAKQLALRVRRIGLRTMK